MKSRFTRAAATATLAFAVLLCAGLSPFAGVGELPRNRTLASHTEGVGELPSPSQKVGQRNILEDVFSALLGDLLWMSFLTR
jgi:hypothetical protein